MEASDIFCTKCGTNLPDDSLFCRKCGYKLAPVIESNPSAPTTNPAQVAAETRSDAPPATGTDAPFREGSSTSIGSTTQTAPSLSVAVTSSQRKSTLNLGTIVFATFSLLSLVVCIVNGIVPIYAIESVMWATLAWYCHKKSPLSQKANLIVLLLAVGVAAGEGYSVGAHSHGKSYTYLQQGNLQYRVDSRSGRTDALKGGGGWEPVSFDRAPEVVELIAASLSLQLTEGKWDSDRICFEIENDSDYVLESVKVSISLEPKPANPNPIYADRWDYAVTLKQYGGGLLDKKRRSQFCGATKIWGWQTPVGATSWSYSISSATGWKE